MIKDFKVMQEDNAMSRTTSNTQLDINLPTLLPDSIPHDSVELELSAWTMYVSRIARLFRL